jgi:hypothetical protein
MSVRVALALVSLLSGCQMLAGVEEGELAPSAGSSGGGSTAAGAAAGRSGGAGSPGAGGTAGLAASGGTAGLAASGGAAGASGGAAGGTAGGTAGGPGNGYADVVLADSPIGYYRFNEKTTPDCLDSSGQANHGTYFGNVTLERPGALAGEPDTAIHVQDGARAEMGDVFDFVGRQPFSIEVWLFPESIAGNGILGKSSYTTSEGYRGIFFAFGPGGDLRFIWATSNTSNTVSGPNLPLDRFSHVVGTFDGVTLRLYVDAQLVQTREPGGDLENNAEPFQIGRATNWGRFGGVIDELAIYDYALPHSRIDTHYRAGSE